MNLSNPKCAVLHLQGEESLKGIVLEHLHWWRQIFSFLAPQKAPLSFFFFYKFFFIVTLSILTYHFTTHPTSIYLFFQLLHLNIIIFYSTSSLSLSSSSSLSSPIQSKQTHKRASQQITTHHTHNPCRDPPTTPMAHHTNTSQASQ